MAGNRVLITGAARGIGAELARRLYRRGARVALAGLEPDDLRVVADDCGGAPWRACDVRSACQVHDTVDALVGELGGLDTVVANAGVASQLPMVGGDPQALAAMLDVNVKGVYHTVSAAGPHISHPGGYAVLTSSLAAAVHAPLLGGYSMSKAATEAMGNTLRVELHASGGRVGVAYFGELDTDMTSRGFGTDAAAAVSAGGPFTRVAPLRAGVDALERGIARQSRRIVAPWWVEPLLHTRMLAQTVADRAFRRGLPEALRIAREEHAPLTTSQPDS